MLYGIEKKTKQNKTNINIDVPHRWNATYLLLDSAIKYKDVYIILIFLKIHVVL